MPLLRSLRWMSRALLAASAALLSGTVGASEGDPLSLASARYARYRVTLDASDLSAAEALVSGGLKACPGDLPLEKLRLRLLLPHHEFREMVEGARALLASHVWASNWLRCS